LEPLKQWFAATDSDKSGEISAAELVTAKWPGDAKLDRETIHKLIRVFDNDYSGSISFYEYASLHKVTFRPLRCISCSVCSCVASLYVLAYVAFASSIFSLLFVVVVVFRMRSLFHSTPPASSLVVTLVFFRCCYV
jgi:EF-hand domain pair